MEEEKEGERRLRGVGRGGGREEKVEGDRTRGKGKEERVEGVGEREGRDERKGRRGWRGVGGGEEREERVEGGLRRREIGEGGGGVGGGEAEGREGTSIHMYVLTYVHRKGKGKEERRWMGKRKED